MSSDPYADNRIVSHKSSHLTMIGQGAVGWMQLNRSARTHKKLEHRFCA